MFKCVEQNIFVEQINIKKICVAKVMMIMGFNVCFLNHRSSQRSTFFYRLKHLIL